MNKSFIWIAVIFFLLLVIGIILYSLLVIDKLETMNMKSFDYTLEIFWIPSGELFNGYLNTFFSETIQEICIVI